MSTPRKTPLDERTIRQKADLYSVHPRTLTRVLRGDVVRGLAGHRIREGLRADGLLHLAPQLEGERLGTFADEPGVAVEGGQERES